MEIFVISDTHFFHENIIKFEDRPLDFNEIIVNNWNSIIQPQDLVIHLGDVIFGLNKEIELPKMMSRLNGKKILCRGNHDPKDALWYLDKGFDFVCDYFVYNNIAFSHAPLTPLPLQTVKEKQRKEDFVARPVDFNIHGHFHRGGHRNESTPDSYFDYKYYADNKDKYELVQIEDELRPFTLAEILERREKE